MKKNNSLSLYYIKYYVIYLLALLPFWVVYRISDIVFLILYYGLKYRKNVIHKNLVNSFPDKSMKEINRLCRDFYRFFCDLMLETFKTLTMSRKQAIRRCEISKDSLNLLEKLYSEKKDIILVLGHYGNWEIAGSSFSSQCSHQLYVIYKPLSSEFFDRLMYKMRTRWGTKLITTHDTYKKMQEIKNTGSATAFIADQTAAPNNAYWTKFMNQDTPVFWGTERAAKQFGYPVVYLTIKRPKRGYYQIFAELLIKNPETTKKGEISEAHTRKLEKDILEQPEIWLWSHRRWKHKKT